MPVKTGEELALLGEHPMPMNVPPGTDIHEDFKARIRVFKRTAHTLPPLGPTLKILRKKGFLLLRRHPHNTRTYLFPRSVGTGGIVEHSRKDFILSIGVVP